MKDKILCWFIENKVAFFVCAAVILGLSIYYIDTHTSDVFKQGFLGGVLVEAHGMLMDIIVFGIVLTLYEKLSENRNEIKRLEEEIDDYRGWNEPEAMYRIVGCIKRLNKKKVRNIDLTNCFLMEADLGGANLGGADLRSAKLQLANLRRVNLQGAIIIGANLREAFLQRANLRGAYLWRTVFEEADFREADFKEADLKGAYLGGADLRGADLRGANLEENIIIDLDLLRKREDLRIEFIEGAYLGGADLQGANLERAKIDNLAQLKTINKLSSKEHMARLVETENDKYYEII